MSRDIFRQREPIVSHGQRDHSSGHKQVGRRRNQTQPGENNWRRYPQRHSHQTTAKSEGEICNLIDQGEGASWLPTQWRDRHSGRDGTKERRVRKRPGVRRPKEPSISGQRTPKLRMGWVPPNKQRGPRRFATACVSRQGRSKLTTHTRKWKGGISEVGQEILEDRDIWTNETTLQRVIHESRKRERSNDDGVFIQHQKGPFTSTFTTDWFLREGEGWELLGKWMKLMRPIQGPLAIGRPIQDGEGSPRTNLGSYPAHLWSLISRPHRCSPPMLVTNSIGQKRLPTNGSNWTLYRNRRTPAILFLIWDFPY